MPEGLVQKIAARTTPPKPWKGTERGQRPGSASTPRQPSAQLPPFAASPGAGLPSRLWVCGTTHEGDKVYVVQLWGHQAHCSSRRSCFLSTALTQCGRPEGGAGRGDRDLFGGTFQLQSRQYAAGLASSPPILTLAGEMGRSGVAGRKGLV